MGEGVAEIAVATAKLVHQFVQGSLNAFVIQVEDALDHAGGAALVSAGHLMSRDEQVRHNTGGVRSRDTST